VAAVLLQAGLAHSQALHVERLPGGIEFILVTLPLSEATTVAWPRADGSIVTTTSGGLTLIDDVGEALSARVETPPVVVSVGGAQAQDLRPVLTSDLGTAIPERPPRPGISIAEGGVERRLGAPRAEALLRLQVPMPEPDDWRRSTVEVLWELLPTLLAADLPGVSSRIDGDVGGIEARVDPASAELKLRHLRLQLARISEEPRIDDDAVAAVRRRLRVRRQALMATHPDAAEVLTELWLRGGVAAVREYLFGVDGVTVGRVTEAARQWLPQHPGRALLILPPRVFNPRFASGPERVQLANDVVAAVLERSTAGLSALCLQPVILPDVDGHLSGTVLTRLAAEMRSSDAAPGWVRVSDRPPVLELAAPDEGFAELVEVLQRTLQRVAEDDRPFADQDPSARRRALQLMARLLGLAEGVGLSPAELLHPSNLAIGVVAPDGEAAIDALRKFSIGGMARGSYTASRSLSPVPQVREAAPGVRSAIVVAVELAALGDPLLSSVVGAVMEHRAKRVFDNAEVDVLVPLVPGRTILLTVVDAEATLDELELRVSEGWRQIVEPVDEEELARARRRVAADVAAQMSGPVGHARRCAAVAAGSAHWRLPNELEMDVLMLSPEVVTDTLAEAGSWQDLQTTGAGVLPIPETAAD
jgi:hypothetical protein